MLRTSSPKPPLATASRRLSAEQATFFQLLAIALQAVRKTRLEVGEGCAVSWRRPGWAIGAASRANRGALPTVAIDRHAGRLALAERLGADYSLQTDAVAEHIRSLDDLADGAPVVIEADRESGRAGGCLPDRGIRRANRLAGQHARRQRSLRLLQASP